MRQSRKVAILHASSLLVRPQREQSSGQQKHAHAGKSPMKSHQKGEAERAQTVQPGGDS